VSTIDFLPDRLNAEPVVFRGLTNREIIGLAGFGLLLWMPVCAFIGFLLGNAVLGMPMGVVVMLLQVYIASIFLTRFKRGRPDNFHMDALAVWLQQKGIKSSGLLLYSGPWDVVRVFSQQRS